MTAVVGLAALGGTAEGEGVVETFFLGAIVGCCGCVVSFGTGVVGGVCAMGDGDVRWTFGCRCRSLAASQAPGGSFRSRKLNV